MFYDLNVPYTPNATELTRTLSFLAERTPRCPAQLVVILTSPQLDTLLSRSISPYMAPCLQTLYVHPHLRSARDSKLSASTSPRADHSPMQRPPLLPTVPNLTVLTRLTITLPTSTPLNSARLQSISKHYSLLALRPTDEKSLAQALAAAEADLVAPELAQRLDFHLRPRHFAAAKGVALELAYAAATAPGAGGSSAADARRNLISNAAALIRATGGGGNGGGKRGTVVLSSGGAGRTLACRAPADVVNLAEVWGLGRAKGMEAVARAAEAVVTRAATRRRGWRDVVEVIDAADPPEQERQGKRKAEPIDAGGKPAEKPVSKRQKKKLAHQARMAEKAKNENKAPEAKS